MLPWAVVPSTFLPCSVPHCWSGTQRWMRLDVLPTHTKGLSVFLCSLLLNPMHWRGKMHNTALAFSRTQLSLCWQSDPEAAIGKVKKHKSIRVVLLLLLSAVVFPLQIQEYIFQTTKEIHHVYTSGDFTFLSSKGDWDVLCRIFFLPSL